MGSEVISAAAAVVAGIVSIVSVRAALRSASASEKSAQSAASALHRAAIRELINLCHEVLAEDLRIHSIGTSLKSELTALGVFSGTSGGSAEMKHKTALEKYLAEAALLAGEAQSISDDHAKLHAASGSDLDKMSAHVGATRVKIRSIRESTERQLAEVREMNQLYRSKRM